jgi:tetratricopeptide (TPR) repeat protein
MAEVRGFRGTPTALMLCAGLLSACALRGPPLGSTPQTAPAPPPPPAAQPLPAPAESAQPEQPPPSTLPPPRQFHLGTAASALVAQAHRQAAGGDYGQAAATLERAQRIEPGNPLIWIELGRLNLAESNAAQADAMARKALALATGDASAQSAAWQLLADSLKARGRNAEAADAEQRAGTAQPR